MAQTDFTLDEVFQKIDSSFDETEQTQLATLQGFDLVQQVKAQALAREKQRLTAKYGIDHARVKKTEAQLRFHAGFARDLKAGIDDASVADPRFDRTTWMIHGRVLDGNNAGLKNMTVSLFDENKQWLQELGFVCTDERGYFALTYPAKAGEQPKIPDTQKLFLTVTGGQRQILHQESEPLFVKIGQIDYREIILTGPKEVCTPPEPEGNQTEEPMPPTSAWIVRGKVTDESGQSLSGLTVSLYDKDLLFDDILGTTLTDANGDFKFIYSTEAFRDLFEKRPDVYLKVLDSEGKTLYTSRKAVRCEARHEEVINVRIKRKQPG